MATGLALVPVSAMEMVLASEMATEQESVTEQVLVVVVPEMVTE